MVYRNWNLFLIAGLLSTNSLSLCFAETPLSQSKHWVLAANEAEEEKTIEESRTERRRAAETEIFEPKVSRQPFNENNIEASNFEFTLNYGFLSIEDFEVNQVMIASFNYHALEDLFISASYGFSKAGETSWERLSGGAEFLTDEERDYSFYQVSVGYNLFPGEVFLGSSRAYNSALYLIGGAGNTDFAGDQQFTVSFGFGFRFIPNNWLAIHFRVKDYVFESNLLGEDKQTHNIELSAGISAFF